MDIPQDPQPMSRGKIIAYAICLPLALLALLFLPADDLAWGPGWLFVAVLLFGFGASAFILARVPGYADYARRVRARLIPGIW